MHKECHSAVFFTNLDGSGWVKISRHWQIWLGWVVTNPDLLTSTVDAQLWISVLTLLSFLFFFKLKYYYSSLCSQYLMFCYDSILNIFIGVLLVLLAVLLYRPKPIHCNYQLAHYSFFCRLSPSILNRFKPTLQAQMGFSFHSNADMWWDAGDWRQVNVIILQR